jgi:hypothetical protein
MMEMSIAAEEIAAHAVFDAIDEHRRIQRVTRIEETAIQVGDAPVQATRRNAASVNAYEVGCALRIGRTRSVAGT